MDGSSGSDIQQQQLEAIFRDHGCGNFKWIRSKDIVINQWVRMKCMFGCHKYGKNASCPPNVPPVDECRRFFNEYRTAVIFHFKHRAPERLERRKWTGSVNAQLSGLERAVFLAGYEKVFLLFMNNCNICAECAPNRTMCKNPRMSRPVPEALGVDVFTTARRCGFPIEVLNSREKEMNRYAFMLID